MNNYNYLGVSISASRKPNTVIFYNWQFLSPLLSLSPARGREDEGKVLVLSAPEIQVRLWVSRTLVISMWLPVILSRDAGRNRLKI